MITVSGIGSGLDIESLVTQLVAAERGPTENRLLRQDARLSSELSGFGIFKSALSSFQSSAAALNSLSSFGQRISLSSDEEVVTVSASAEAIPGSYDLSVTQLAKGHSLASAAYTSLSDTVGTGELTIRFGTTDYVGPDPGPESYNSFDVNAGRGVATVTIDSSNNTLEGLRNAINDSNIGVSATIVNDGSGFRLLLNSGETGAENSIEISVDDTGDANNVDANGLSALAFNSSATNLTETVTAQDAIFSINGLSINSAQNQVSGAIQGVDLTLKDLSGTAPITLSVAEDRAGVKEAINTFVEGYNQFISVANTLTSYDATSNNAGVLQGDFSARSIVGQLRQVLANSVDGLGGSFSSLSEIGITTDSDGTLNIDSPRLDSALEENFDQMAGLFTAVGSPSDIGVEYIGSSDATAITSHAVEITRLASQGQLVGAAPLAPIIFPVTVDNDNDELTIKVDGATSASISLTQGAYASGDALAAELQARINGDATLVASGALVNVTFNTDHFEITSQKYGGESRVEILAVDTDSELEFGFSVAAGTVGLNVEGTIGGVAALGSGHTLTGAFGTDAEGLKISVESGALGARGTVDFSRGVSAQLNVLLSNFLDSEGILESRTEGIGERVSDIADARLVLDRRMEALEIQLRTRFTTLDTLLSQLQSTSDFLTQQLGSLLQPNSINRN